ncbi:hypothetical protein E4U42_003200 [Claviceps africana]|uniref:Uncharacterized protein n=1 Tax=Claviceps africana TaxID=83212 RepID=A0A8K0JCE4_9HYPO|nr:hypothetical protein E4U42_003200 [Claviceps africana]
MTARMAGDGARVQPPPIFHKGFWVYFDDIPGATALTSKILGQPYIPCHLSYCESLERLLSYLAASTLLSVYQLLSFAMLRAIPWTVLALAHVTHARFGRLSLYSNSNECCPCPAPGQSSNGGTVITVTQAAQTVYVSLAQEPPTRTVTVERTVTIDTHTVYVAQSNDGPSVSPRPQFNPQTGPQTITVTKEVKGVPQGDSRPLHVTTTVQPESPKRLSDAEPKTVTVTAGPPALVSVLPAAQDQPSSGSPWSSSVVADTREWRQKQQVPGVVTVTGSPEPPAANTIPAAQSQGPKTVVVTVQPSPPTAQPAAVTASLQAQTIVQTLEQYCTFTRTVGGGGGGDNIEIIIINIYTGETSCKRKHSGKSCHGMGHTGSHRFLSSTAAATAPSQMPRPSVNITTSAASAYGTGIVTLSSGNFTGAAQPTGSGGSASGLGRKPRGPLSLRKW